MSTSSSPLRHGVTSSKTTPYIQLSDFARDASPSGQDPLQEPIVSQKGPPRKILGIPIRLSSGYRSGMKLCLASVMLVFVVNLLLLAGSLGQSGRSGGLGTLHKGGCSDVKNAGKVLHLFINILSTILLGASNYCMHVVASPTRKDLDRLHAKKKTATIGLNDFTNLPKLGWPRRFMWCLLGLSSIPLHLM